MTSKEKNTYRALTYIFVFVLFCHILLATFVIFNPSKKYLTGQRWEKAYRLFALTGPFFSEDRINVIPRVYCAVKEHGGQWRSFEELGKKEFQRYHQNYLDYDQLLLSGLPRHLGAQIQTHKNNKHGDQKLLSLKTYIQLSNPTLQIDSVTVVYILESLVEAKKDTLFVRHITVFDTLSTR